MPIDSTISPVINKTPAPTPAERSEYGDFHVLDHMGMHFTQDSLLVSTAQPDTAHTYRSQICKLNSNLWNVKRAFLGLSNSHIMALYILLNYNSTSAQLRVSERSWRGRLLGTTTWNLLCRSRDIFSCRATLLSYSLEVLTIQVGKKGCFKWQKLSWNLVRNFRW